MADEVEVTKQDDEAEFDAAFAERAIESDTLSADPGEVGEESGSEEADEFSKSFDNAADPAAALKEEESKPDEENDTATRLAEQEAEIERLRQSEKSQRGRVSALNKKLAEQRAALKPPEAEESKEGESTKDSDWEEFHKEFPEMAAIVDARMKKYDSKFDSVTKQVEKVSSTTETLADDSIKSYMEKQTDLLRKADADLDAITASTEFAEWRKNAPEEIQVKIQSHSVEESVEVLKAFKTETGWKSKSPVTDPPPAKKSDVERINEKRAAALKNSAGISSKKVGHSATLDKGDDFDSAFEEATRKKQKERSAVY